MAGAHQRPARSRGSRRQPSAGPPAASRRQHGKGTEVPGTVRPRLRPSTRDRTGRGGHCRLAQARHTVQQRRNAMTPGVLGASVTGLRTDARTEDGRIERSRTRITSRVTKAGIRPRAGTRLGGTYPIQPSSIAFRLAREAIVHVREAFGAPLRGEHPARGGSAAARSYRTGAGRGRRTIPRRSRSPCRDRAAATSSGSCEMVRASQSM